MLSVQRPFSLAISFALLELFFELFFRNSFLQKSCVVKSCYDHELL